MQLPTFKFPLANRIALRLFLVGIATCSAYYLPGLLLPLLFIIAAFLLGIFLDENTSTNRLALTLACTCSLIITSSIALPSTVSAILSTALIMGFLHAIPLKPRVTLSTSIPVAVGASYLTPLLQSHTSPPLITILLMGALIGICTIQPRYGSLSQRHERWSYLTAAALAALCLAFTTYVLSAPLSPA